jgi:hypothetical protein
LRDGEPRRWQQGARNPESSCPASCLQRGLRRRRAALVALGVSGELRNMAGSGRGPWHLARSKALSVGLSNAYFKSLGLVPVRSALAQLLEPPWYGPVCQVVWISYGNH